MARDDGGGRPRRLHVAVACGGTGGHVVVGVVSGEALQRRDHRVALWLAGREVEKLAAASWRGQALTVPASGFPEGFSLRSISSAFGLIRALLRCAALMRQDPPDVLLGMGSYSSVGPVLAARRMGIPIVLHEANAVPGRAVSWLARWASAVAVAFEEAAGTLPDTRIAVTGLPLRKRLTERNGERLLPPGPFTLLVMGGSQGAHRLNEVASEAVVRLRRGGSPVQVVHLAGTRDESFVAARYREAGVPHAVFGFLGDMGRAYRTADLAVARAGAGACMELAACAVPALLVPLPCARRDHQTANARAMATAGVADVAGEAELSAERLADYVERCRNDADKLGRMRKAAEAVARRDADDRLADLVESVAR